MAQTPQVSLVELPIGGGMNEKVHPYRAQQPTLIQNARQWKTGSLSKRWGAQGQCPNTYQNKRSNYSARDASSPTLLTSTGPELLRAGGGDLDCVFSATATTSLVWRDRISECTVARRPIEGQSTGGVDFASDTLKTLSVYVTVTVSTVVVTAAVRDYATQILRFDPVAITAAQGASSLRALIVGGVGYVVWHDATTNVKIVSIDLTTGALGTVHTLAANAGANSSTQFDACTDGITIYWATNDSTQSSNRVLVGAGTPAQIAAGTFFTTHIGGTDAAAKWFCMCVGASRLHVGYAFASGGTTTFRAAALTTALVTSWGPTTLTTGTSSVTSPGVCEWAANEAVWTFAFQSVNTLNVVYTTSTGSTTGTPLALHNVLPITKPFIQNGRAYVVALPVHSKTSLYTLLEIPADSTYGYAYFVAAQFARDEILDMANALGTLSDGRLAGSVSAFGESATFGCFTSGATGTTLSIGVTTAFVELFTLHLATINFAAPTLASTSQEGLILSGGCPSIYDGAKCSEIGFFYGPDTLTATQSHTGFGALIPGQTYGYKAVYHAIDDLGRVSFSQVSPTLFVTITGSNDAVSVVVPCCTLSNRVHNLSGRRVIYIGLYRTTGDGSTYQLAQTVLNDNTAASVTIIDSDVPDADLGAFIYTDGSTGSPLEYEPPPSGAHVAVALGRVWVSGTDDDYVWFSGTLISGQIPWFNSANVIAPFGIEPTVAVAQLDDKVILFKNHSIWFTFGAGPSTNGTGAFADIERISSEIGCVDPRGITTTVDGIWFNSEAGPCLLDRSLQIHTPASPVEDSAGETQTTEWTICAGASLGQLQETRFAIAGSGDQRAIVYDDHHGTPQQPVWYRYNWNTPVGGPEIVSACLHQDLWTWITTDGYVYQEQQGSYLDFDANGLSNWVTFDVWSGTLTPGTIEGWMLANLAGVLAESLSPHDVTVTIYQDWTTDSSVPRTWTAAEIAALPREQILVRIVTEPCQSLRVRITDATPTGVGSLGTGQGLRLTAFAVEVTPQRTITPHLPVGAIK